jgi:hypothetical protein
MSLGSVLKQEGAGCEKTPSFLIPWGVLEVPSRTESQMLILGSYWFPSGPCVTSPNPSYCFLGPPPEQWWALHSFHVCFSRKVTWDTDRVQVGHFTFVGLSFHTLKWGCQTRWVQEPFQPANEETAQTSCNQSSRRSSWSTSAFSPSVKQAKPQKP